MSKIPVYEKTKKTNFENKPKKDCITILITEKNFIHLEKCLDDPAFIASISKLIFKEYTNQFSVRVGVTNLIKTDEFVSVSHIIDK